MNMKQPIQLPLHGNDFEKKFCSKNLKDNFSFKAKKFTNLFYLNHDLFIKIYTSSPYQSFYPVPNKSAQTSSPYHVVKNKLYASNSNSEEEDGGNRNANVEYCTIPEVQVTSAQT